MLGRNHALLGLSAYLGTVMVAEHAGLPFSPGQLALGAVVAVGAALAPDLDEPNSLAGRANPIALLPLWGPHRRRTHSLLAVGVVTALAVAVLGHPLGAGILAGALACSGAGAWSWRIRRSGWLIAVPLGVLVGWMVSSGLVAAGPWLPLAIGPAWLSHLVGDGMTPGGVPVFWPAPGRWSIPLFHVGGRGEQWVVRPLLLLGTGALAWMVLTPVAAAALGIAVPAIR